MQAIPAKYDRDEPNNAGKEIRKMTKNTFKKYGNTFERFAIQNSGI
jgi:hypothetical protein